MLKDSKRYGKELSRLRQVRGRSTRPNKVYSVQEEERRAHTLWSYNIYIKYNIFIFLLFTGSGLIRINCD